MITANALQELLNHVCRAAARRAALRIPQYDLDTVERYLDMMAQDNMLGWKHNEIIATLEARTTSKCPDPDDPDQAAIMTECFQEAVREITGPPGVAAPPKSTKETPP